MTDYKKLKDTVEYKLEENIYDITDKEYYFLVGQYYYYLVSHSNFKHPSQALLLPILNVKTNTLMKKVIEREYNKYSYEIDLNNQKFRNAMLLINNYNPKNSCDKENSKSYLYIGLTYVENIFLNENIKKNKNK